MVEWLIREAPSVRLTPWSRRSMLRLKRMAAFGVSNLLRLTQVPFGAARSKPTRPPEASGVRAASGPAEKMMGAARLLG